MTNQAVPMKDSIRGWLATHSDALYRIQEFVRSAFSADGTQQDQQAAVRLMWHVASIVGEDYGEWKQDWSDVARQVGLDLTNTSASAYADLDARLNDVLASECGLNMAQLALGKRQRVVVSYLERMSQLKLPSASSYSLENSGAYKPYDVGRAYATDPIFGR
jgi:hypothetical protein